MERDWTGLWGGIAFRHDSTYTSLKLPSIFFSIFLRFEISEMRVKEIVEEGLGKK